MQTVYTPHHAGHHPDLEFFEGKLQNYHDAPMRVQIILDAIVRSDLGEVLPPDDFGLAPIHAIHAPDYLDYLQHAYENWVADGGIPAGVYPDTFPVRGMNRRPKRPLALAGYYSMDVTAIIVSETWRASYYAAQCALTASQLVLAGQRVAFALCRPPGHHAGTDLCGGYSFLNNAAIAANWLVDPTLRANSSINPARRVAILDIDFHHGNGTQQIFYHRSDVLYVSLHADPDREYPYFSGSAYECGEGDGLGFTVNFPLPKGIVNSQYLDVLRQACEHISRYAPQQLFVSLGVDTFIDDPLGDFSLTAGAYPQIGATIAQLGLPTVFIMEGGYAIRRIGENVVGVLHGFESV